MAKQEKLKKYEIDALVSTVVEQIKRNKLKSVEEKHSKKVDKFLEEYETLNKAENIIAEKKTKLQKVFEEMNKVSVPSWNRDKESILNQFLNLPSTYNIEREIILKGMFTSNQELEEFIKELVKKFS